MYRILIVEDEEPTRRRLANEIQAEMPEVEILTAGSFEDALKLIGEAHAEGLDIHVATLDAQLPRGGTKVISMDLCNIVSVKFPGVLVIHFTAYADDPLVEDHIRAQHSTRRVHEFFPKSGNWIEVLISELLRDKVERGLNNFFSVGRSVAHPMFRRGGATFELAELTEDIERYWKRLPEETRQRILDDFDVDDRNPEQVVVSLGGRDAN